MQVRQLHGTAMDVSYGVDAPALRQSGRGRGEFDHNGTGYQSAWSFGKRGLVGPAVQAQQRTELATGGNPCSIIRRS